MGAYHGITVILAAPWLGSGRTIEAYLTFVTGFYGALILWVPYAALDSQATRDIALTGYGPYLAIPLLTKAVLSGTGLISNIRGGGLCQPLRFMGAFIGMMIWTFLIYKFWWSGDIVTVGFAHCVFSALFSIRIMGMTWANLPHPGSPGLHG